MMAGSPQLPLAKPGRRAGGRRVGQLSVARQGSRRR
jgi:hypothetical protein